MEKVSESAAELSADVEKLQNDLGLVLQNSETTEKENVQLQARLAELETQVSELKRLLTIESEVFSSLQNREVDSVAATSVKDHAPQISALESEQKTTSVVQPDQQKEEAKPETFIGGLLKDPTALGLVAVVGLGLLALGAIVMRRRSRDNESFEDDDYDKFVTTLPLSESDKPSSALAQFGVPVSNEDPPTEAVAATEQAAIAEEDMQLDYEIDPIDEADVYIAYRRYPQAEDLLKEAIQIDPDRNELHVKLLEIYAATDDQAAFIAQSELLKVSIKDGEDHLWSEVSSMASKVCPGHELFQDGEKVTLLQDDKTTQLSSFDADALDESPPILSEEIELTGDEKLFEEELVVEHLTQQEQMPSENAQVSEGDNSITFEGGLGAGLSPLVKNTEDKGVAGFDEAGDVITESLEKQIEPLEKDLDDLPLIDDDFSIPDTSLTDEGLVDSDDDWLSKMDEIGTRLDLARAYVDMGDEAGAREILDDVLEKGDDQQKKDALNLMQQLS